MNLNAPPSAESTDPLVGFYRRRHPMYDRLAPHWAFCEATYRGGPEWAHGNIFRYLKEGEQEFADRLSRSYRPNHTRECVDLIQKYLFKGGVKRDVAGAPEAVKKFWAEATRNGQTIDEEMRIASTKSSLSGRCAVVVDATRLDVPENAKVSISEVKGKQRIYSYVVVAQDILDYAWSEDDGKLLWIKLREFYRDDADPLTASGDVMERVRLWTRSNWTLFESAVSEDGKTETVDVVDSGEHGLGYVPVYLLDHSSASETYSAAGLVDNIAYLDRAVANYLSNLDAIIQDQTFSQLVIPSSAIPNADNNGSARAKLVEMGTNRIFTYDASAGSHATPEFISPDPKQANVILSVVNKIIAEIYQTIGMGGERTKQDNAVGIDNSSGVAKAYDFERINSLLASKAQRLEQLENWIVATVLDWAGETQPKEPLVTYPSSFDVATLGDELVTAEALQKVEAPIEVRREQMKSIVEKLLPQVKQTTWDSMVRAIDKWEVTPKVLPASQQPGGAKVAAPKRQGSVTPETKSTPKNAAK